MADNSGAKPTQGRELIVPRPYKTRGGLLIQGTCYRAPEPLTIRYRSEPGVRPITDDLEQKEVAGAIWKRLGNLIPKRSYALNIVMGIVFDQEVVLPEAYAVIDIVCGTAESCEAIQKELREIHFRSDTGRDSVFKQYSSCTTLPSNVLPFDIYDWWVRPGDVGKLATQLEEMAAPLGTLIGSVHFMLTTSMLTQPDEFYRVLRGHILLSSSTLQLSRDEVDERQTFMFGGTNRIWYSECHLDYYKEWARQHPDQAAHYEEPDEVAIARQQAREIADASAPGASKKRKGNS